MPDVQLTQQQKTQAQKVAHHGGHVCKECQTRDLISPDTGRSYADGSLHIYMDCYQNEEHQTGVWVEI